MEFRNYMEVVVERKLNEVLAQYPTCCKCDICRQDIAMLALNHLPPHYTTTEKGQIFARVAEMSSENEIKVIREIASAIEKVQNNPRHPK